MGHLCLHNAYEVIQQLFNIAVSIKSLARISVEMGTEVELASIPTKHA